MRAVDPARHQEILDEVSDGVVHERGNDRRSQAEATTQASGDVVLAAALVCPERASAADAALAGVEPKHHLAEGDAVPARLGSGRDFEEAHRASPGLALMRRTISTAAAALAAISSNRPAAISSRGAPQLPPQARTDSRAR